MEGLIIIEVFVFDELPNMVPGFPNGLKDNIALNNDRKITTNEISERKILPEFGMFRNSSFNFITN